jgi:hypothetical protein
MKQVLFRRVFCVLLLYWLLVLLLSACGAEAQGQNAECIQSPNCNINQSQSGSSSNGQSSPASASSPAAAIPSPTSTPAPIPPTPTPIPPSVCADQNGTPPSGVEATKMTINCELPSGFVALIVVCDEAHLLQPYDAEVEGPGLISYQNPAGSSSISIDALNTPLANAPCPAKFLVLSPSQVDGQVAQETQRLKTLIGNNGGVTYAKVVGENITRTYS